MALKVKATEQMMKIGTYAGKYRYVMMPELYTALKTKRKCSNHRVAALCLLFAGDNGLSAEVIVHD